MSSNSGASSLPYISRSLSIDAYTQQQLELKKSQKCSELEEYAKRYITLWIKNYHQLMLKKIIEFIESSVEYKNDYI